MFKPDNIENDFFTRLSFKTDPSLLKPGAVLISEPFLPDPNFSRTVVLLTAFDGDEGAFGFILNRPLGVSISSLFEDVSRDEFELYFGGPVNPEALFYLHTLGDLIDDAKPLFDNLFWGGDFDTLKSMLQMGKLSPSDIRFFSGYSGWSPGQLEAELEEGSWIIGELKPEQIFSIESTQLWKTSLKQLGNKFSIMAGFPENPGWN
ncbi:MAG: YqgE/AlgH family protein [Salibacteraceae bacterium]